MATGRSRWLAAALACAGLLVVPVLALLLSGGDEPARSDGLPRERPPPVRPAAAWSSGAHPAAPGKAQSVAAGPAAEAADAEPDRSEAVSGTVVDPQGGLLGGATVRCARDAAPALAATTDADGRFELPAEADGCEAVASHAEHADSDPTRLVVGDRNLLRLRRGARIDGVVVDEGGKPLAQATVVIDSYRPPGNGPPTGRRPERRELTDAEGRFTIEGLGAGDYVLGASLPDRPTAESDGIRLDRDGWRSVRIALFRGAAMTGRVVEVDGGGPIAGARVALSSAHSVDPRAAASSAGDGTFRLEPVPPSEPFSVEASAPGYQTRILGGLRVPPSGPLDQTIALGRRDAAEPATEYCGIGASIGLTPGGIALTGVFAGGPAAQAGLEPGDLLARIDGREASGLSLDRAMQLLRGPEGASVAVTVVHDGARREIVLTRRKVQR